LTQTWREDLIVAVQSIHKRRVAPGGLRPPQLLTGFSRLPERIGDVFGFLPRPEQRLGDQLLGVPLDIAMKFVLGKQLSL
jgi:hypothetical protein